MAEFPVVASAGTLRADPAAGWTLPHDWTPDGVVVGGDGNGAAVLHLSVALCVLNDAFREGQALGVPVSGVRVSVGGHGGISGCRIAGRPAKVWKGLGAPVRRRVVTGTAWLLRW